MTNKENLKKQIIYRSTHRGTKEMDLLLGNFVKNNIDALNDIELKYLEEFLLIEDEILYNWYFNKKGNIKIPKNKISEKLRNFKLS
tara:strand:+ start:1252 stop:1509 length:258 start_codon:yes stop_codon:yes gene_type:complete